MKVFDLWRFCIAVSFAVALVRVSPIGGNDQGVFWTLAQFAPIIIAALAASFNAQRWYFNAVGWALLAWVILALFSSIWSAFPTATLRQASLLALVFGFLIVTSSTRWLERSVLIGDLKFFYWLIASAMIVGLLLIWFIDPAALMWRHSHYQGVFPNPNSTALLAAQAMAIGIWLLIVDERISNRLAVFASMFAIVATITATCSRGPRAVLLIGIMVALWFSPYRRRALCYAAGIVVLIVTFPNLLLGRFCFRTGTDGSDFTSGRIGIWEFSLNLWQENPILGAGYRTFELIPASHGYTAHNIYLSILAELGVVGLFMLLVVFVIIVVSGIKSSVKTDRMLLGVIVVILASGMTEAYLFGFGGTNSMITWLILIAFAALGRERQAVSEAREATTFSLNFFRHGR